MKKFTFYCLLAMLCTYANGYGQTKQLHIGDAVPPMQFTNVFNHNNLPLQLPSGNGKAVILDLFATWCGGCIKELPRLAALQDSLDGRLQIVLVSCEPKAKLEAFLQKRKVARAFPIIYEDTVLNRLFPNRILPHDVWIGPDGIVKAITGGPSVELMALQRLLRGETLKLPLKRDLMDFTSSKPLLIDGNGPEEALLYRSSFTKHIEGVLSAVGKQLDSGGIRRYQVNQWLPKMFAAAWKTTPNRLLTELPEDDPFWRNPNNRNGTGEQFYCYEISAPAITAWSVLEKMMQQDLCRYTGYECSVETRRVSAFRIISLQQHGIAKPAMSVTTAELTEPDEQFIQFDGHSFAALAQRLNELYAVRPEGPTFLADSASQLPVDFRLKFTDLANIETLKTALQSQGLNLQSCFIDADMLVIRRPSTNNSITQ